MINIRKLIALISLPLWGCTSAENLEKLVINKILSDTLPTSAQSDYAVLNLSNDLLKEQDEDSITLGSRYNPYSISTFSFRNIEEWYPVYLNEIRSKSDDKDENGKNVFYIPEIFLDLYESTEPSDTGLTFKQKFDSYLSNKKYHKIEYRVVDFIKNPTLDHLERAALGLSVGYIGNLDHVINFRENVQREIGSFISRGFDGIGINGVDAKASTKGLQFTSGNKTFTLGKTLEFRYEGLNNHFTGVCKGKLSGVLDGDFLFGCRFKLL